MQIICSNYITMLNDIGVKMNGYFVFLLTTYIFDKGNYG